MTKQEFTQFELLLRDLHLAQLSLVRLRSQLKELAIYQDFLAELNNNYQKEADNIKVDDLPF